jgi:hypothetical protein
MQSIVLPGRFDASRGSVEERSGLIMLQYSFRKLKASLLANSARGRLYAELLLG